MMMKQLMLFLVGSPPKKTEVPDFLRTRKQFSLIAMFALTIRLPVVTQTQGVTNMRVLGRNLKKQEIITVNYMLLYMNTIWKTKMYT